MTDNATYTNTNVSAYATANIAIWCDSVWNAFNGEFKQIFACAADWAADIVRGFNTGKGAAVAYVYRVESELGLLDFTVTRDGGCTLRYVD